MLSNSHASPALDLPYDGSPFPLFWSDIKLCFTLSSLIPRVIWPLGPWPSGSRDELFPCPANLWDILLHSVLIVAQLLFLIALPVAAFCFVGAVVIPSAAAFMLLNYAICNLFLNGRGISFTSKVDLSQFPEHKNEKWIFVNGISTGHNWLQSSIDRLAMTFGREIHGIHNRTYGIVFDLLQCLVERDFLYYTQHTRVGHARVKEALQNPQYTKVVLILHSQGGIQGGLMVDLLLEELSENTLRKLEVYTFASAANHFNNPKRYDEHQSLGTVLHPRVHRIFKHVEHYANSRDFVSHLGVLGNPPTRSSCFPGSLFEREGTGHLLNQHYLDPMFTLDPVTKRVAETNEFMETLVDVETVLGRQKGGGGAIDNQSQTLKARNGTAHAVDSEREGRFRPVKELSRLWAYRNGLSPLEPDDNHVF